MSTRINAPQDVYSLAPQTAAWTGTGTTNTGNANRNTFDYNNNELTKRANMNRSRWYSSSIAMTSGEIYIQGGSGGRALRTTRSTSAPSTRTAVHASADP